MNQDDLAARANVDQGNRSKIERGKMPAIIETYLRLFSALEINLYAESQS
jgi:transcriptional regulator with XRE-family HTH domain